MTASKASATTLFVLACIMMSGCYSINRTAVQASSSIPESAQVEEIHIPRDSSLPTYVLVIEPFTTESAYPVAVDNRIYNGCYNGICGYPRDRSDRGYAVSSQLMSALSNAENFSIATQEALQKRSDGTYSAKLQRGEVGPFIVRGLVTELSETVDTSDSMRNVNLGWVGLVMGVAGAVAGKPGLGWTGAGVAAANPTLDFGKQRKVGMVALDLQVIDGRTQRLVRSFKTSGSFASESSSNGLSLFGIGGKEDEFAQSVLGQAIRVAMNNAAQQILDSLRTTRRTPV